MSTSYQIICDLAHQVDTLSETVTRLKEELADSRAPKRLVRAVHAILVWENKMGGWKGKAWEELELALLDANGHKVSCRGMIDAANTECNHCKSISQGAMYYHHRGEPGFCSELCLQRYYAEKKQNETICTDEQKNG